MTNYKGKQLLQAIVLISTHVYKKITEEPTEINVFKLVVHSVNSEMSIQVKTNSFVK